MVSINSTSTQNVLAQILMYGPVMFVTLIVFVLAVLTSSGSCSSREALVEYYDTGATQDVNVRTCAQLCERSSQTACYDNNAVLGYGLNAAGAIVQTIRTCNTKFVPTAIGKLCACQGPLTNTSSSGFTSS
jgi:hypothetical protein